MQANCKHCGKMMIWDSDGERYYCTCALSFEPTCSTQELIVGTMYVDPDPDEDYSGMAIAERWGNMLREKGITGNIEVVLRVKR